MTRGPETLLLKYLIIASIMSFFFSKYFYISFFGKIFECIFSKRNLNGTTFFVFRLCTKRLRRLTIRGSGFRCRAQLQDLRRTDSLSLIWSVQKPLTDQGDSKIGFKNLNRAWRVKNLLNKQLNNINEYC